MSTMTYLDFDLEIDTGDGLDYTVKALQAQMGEARAAVRWPWSELQLENRLKDLQIALLRSGGVRRDFRYPEEEAVQRFGQELFELIFTGDVRSRYDVTQERARQQGKGVRLKLRIQAPRLAILPWEFLYDGRAAEYICLSRNTPVVRYLELPQSIQPLTVTLPLRILGMIASPSDLPALDVAVEKERVERAVQELKQAGAVELTWLTGQTWRDLHREMRRGPWHIFHFVGHGDFDARRQEGEIVLTGADGKAQPFSATDFARLLADHRTLRLALLNACKGAHGGVKDIFAGTAARLVRSGLPAVIAMQHAITDMAAIEFSQGFYESLADGLAVDAAMSEARKAIVFGVANSLEWGTPVLYMRAPDGVLFKLEKEIERLRDQETERPGDKKNGEQGGEGQKRGDAGVEAGEPAAQPVTPQPTARITNHESHDKEAAPDAVTPPDKTDLPKTKTPKAETPNQPDYHYHADLYVPPKTEAPKVESATARKAVTDAPQRSSPPADEGAPTVINPQSKIQNPKSKISVLSFDWVEIPEGEFWMGSRKTTDPAEKKPGFLDRLFGATPTEPVQLAETPIDSRASDDELPQHRLYLPTYYIARTPVTVAQFTQFVQATAHQTTAEKQGSAWGWTGSKYEEIKGASWQHPRGPQSDVKQKDDHPVTCVSWHDAMAFCGWATKEYNKSGQQGVIRLLTEAEWEKAARGTDGRIYPWGNEAPDKTRCNFNMHEGDTTPVNKYGKVGASPYHVWDMSGNVWEWTGSLYKPYPYKKDDGREEAEGGGGRVWRGGSFNDTEDLVRCASRRNVVPDTRSDICGFRVCLPRL